MPALTVMEASDSPASARGWLAWAVPAVVVALSLAAFLPALSHGFVNWDDEPNFLNNPHYRGLGPRQIGWMLTTFHMGHYIPLTWLTLGLDYCLWGMDARGYHLTSLGLHVATALLFYFVSLRLLRLAGAAGSAPALEPAQMSLRIGAAVAALAFAVHPLRAESVVWITERRDVLSGFFYVATVLAYLRAVNSGDAGRRSWYWTAVGLHAAGLLSKSMVVTLPIVLLVLDVYPLRRLGGPRGWRVREIWLEKVPFVLASAIATVIAFTAVLWLGSVRSLADMGPLLRAVLAAYGLAFYLLKTVLPLDLSPLYQLPLTVTWLHFLIVIGGTAAAILLRRRFPAFTAAWVAYGVTLAPVLGPFQNGPQAVADRYSYLACLGWALLAGWAVARSWAGTGVVRALAALAILALAALTWQQTEIWRNGVTLWSHAVIVNPESRAAHANLARAYAAEGKVAPAIAHWEETARLSLNKAHPHVAIGELYEKAGQRREARDRYVEALRLMPGLPSACVALKRLADGAAPPDVLASCPP
jgi:protein O-mannosyl-transferase